MAVKTSPFTGWRLSGRDADAFIKQIDESNTNTRALNALMRGRSLCKEMTEKGYSSVNPKRENIFKSAYSYIKRIFMSK